MVGKSYPLAVVISGIDRVTGPLRLIRQQLSALKAPFREVSNAATALGRAGGVPEISTSFASARTAVGAFNEGLQTSIRRLAIVGGAGAGLAFLFNREFIGTADTFERLTLSLEAIEGSSEKAKRSLAFIKDLAVKTPFETEEVAKAFRIMRGFGVENVEGSLVAITDQVAKLGLTGEDLTGIALQLGQAWSKGRLQAQDANILVERGVPVWAMLARAVERVNKGQKVSVADLRKMSEDGKLGLGAIRMLIEQMGIESAGSAAKMMSSWSGMISNLRDRWTFFKLAVMDSGPFRVLKQQLQGVLDTLDRMAANGELQAWADRIGAALLRAFDWLRTEGPGIWAQVRTGLEGIWRVASTVADALGGWGNLGLLALAGYIGGPLIASVASLGAALMSLNLTLAGTPIGLLLLGGAAIIGGAWGFANYRAAQLKREWEEDQGGGPRRRERLPWAAPSPFGGAALQPGPPVTTGVSAPKLQMDAAQFEALRGAMAAPGASQSRVIVDVNGPAGTRARIDPRSTGALEVNTGISNLETR